MTAHALDELSSEEISQLARVVRDNFSNSIRTTGKGVTNSSLKEEEGDPEKMMLFNYITLAEPTREELSANCGDGDVVHERRGEVMIIVPWTGEAYKYVIAVKSLEVVKVERVKKGQQPLITPDDCLEAERICKNDEKVKAMMKERYGIEDLTMLVCDPWSVHVTEPGMEPLDWRKDDGEIPARLVQTFLYWRDDDLDDNQYAHPIDLLPVVDLNAGKVVDITCQDVPREIPMKSVNYHREKLKSNSYLANVWRDAMKPLEIVQPEGAAFKVDGRLVKWDKWTLRVGFNYREGLVLHDVKYDNRPILHRASLVEMAVPYADPNPPYTRKCAFDVGDYGLGYCTDSLELGCDCLGNIHYFDATLANSKGEPYVIKKAVCMHEEDHGLLWKHVEYRTGHSEARRSRRLVLSFIATVVNYEYLFYYYFQQDGTIEFEIKLTGELSTNAISAGESNDDPTHGVLVAPGVNSQIHQHMFCARLDVAIDGNENEVSEIDICSDTSTGSCQNVFGPVTTPLVTELQARRVCDSTKARVWKISNPSSLNPVTKKPVSYKLIPFTRGPAMPTLLTGPECAVTKKGEFATKNLWVTPYNWPNERWPAGEFTVQGALGEGLPEWTKDDRDISSGELVIWHAFGVVHIPRPEDFPVMPVEHTGFSLKPDGFFAGNPTIDLPPPKSGKSTCCSTKL